MEEQLKLKHLAPYLPYKVVMYYDLDGRPFRGTKKKEVLTIDNIKLLLFSNHRKPILRPLSDLKVNGNSEKLLHDISEKAKQMNVTDDDFDYYCHRQHDNKGYDYLPHWWFQDLIKNHFDVFGLIKKGLAINYNKLK